MKWKYNAPKHFISAIYFVVMRRNMWPDLWAMNQQKQTLYFPLILNAKPKCPTNTLIIVFAHCRCCKNCPSTRAPKPTMNPSCLWITMILMPARLTLDIESIRMVEMETDIKNGCTNMKLLKYESDFPQLKMVSIKLMQWNKYLLF